MSAPDRRAKLDRNHPELSIRRQCAMLCVARSGVYRTRCVANDNDLDLMRRLDELFLRWPFLGSRRMVALLAAEGVRVNRKRERRLMRLMGIVPLGPKPRTSKPGAGHKIYPYLLRDLAIGRGFLYLVAIMDWHSRAVLAWRISNTMDVRFCVSALEECHSALRQAGDFQHRPRVTVHLGGIHRHAECRRDQNFDPLHLHDRTAPLPP
jgi:putative transposase